MSWWKRPRKILVVFLSNIKNLDPSKTRLFSLTKSSPSWSLRENEKTVWEKRSVALTFILFFWLSFWGNDHLVPQFQFSIYHQNFFGNLDCTCSIFAHFLMEMKQFFSKIVIQKSHIFKWFWNMLYPNKIYLLSSVLSVKYTEGNTHCRWLDKYIL